MSATETFFMGGIQKKRVLEVFKPHIYFDDQLGHLEPSAQNIPSVFIPFATEEAVNAQVLAGTKPKPQTLKP